MQPVQIHPVIRDLLDRAVGHMERTAIDCGEIAEQLENGELAAALGALVACETTIRTTLVVVRAAHEWQQMQSQTTIPFQPKRTDQNS